MKTALRMLGSTVTAAVVLYTLYFAREYFVAQSMLGPTVDRIVTGCFQLLALVTILLYVRCWLSLLVDGIRALVRHIRRRRRVQLNIKTDSPARLYDQAAENAGADS